MKAATLLWTMTIGLLGLSYQLSNESMEFPTHLSTQFVSAQQPTGDDAAAKKEILDALQKLQKQIEGVAKKADLLETQDKKLPLPPVKDAQPNKGFQKGVHGRGYKAPSKAVMVARHEAMFKKHDHKMARLTKNATPPATWDCVQLGWCQPIQDQGSCGSCYLVSTVDMLTCANIKAGWGKNDGSICMAAQYGMDCHDFGGCNGGDGWEVATYMQQTGWIAQKYIDANGQAQSDYPAYEASSGSCRTKAGAKVWKVKDMGFVAGDQGQGPASVDATKAALMAYGTLSIAIDASDGDFGNYNTGVMQNLGDSIDHETTCVGWDDSKAAFKCRNQWGTGWGESGYYWVAYTAWKHVVEVFWITVEPVGPTPSQITVAVSGVQGLVSQPVQFLPIATGGTAPYTFSYDYGDGGKDSTGTHVYAAAGEFNVTVTATDSKGLTGTGSCNASISTTPPPIPPTPPSGAVTIVLNTDGTYTITGGLIVSQATMNMTVGDLLKAAQQPTPQLSADERAVLQNLLNRLKKGK